MKTSFSAKKPAAPVAAPRKPTLVEKPLSKNEKAKLAPTLKAAPAAVAQKPSGLGRRVPPTAAAPKVKEIPPAAPAPEEVYEPAPETTQQAVEQETVAPAEAPHELAPVQTGHALALPTGELEGEISQSDLSIPHLQIVQAVGPLSEHYTPGQLILAKEVIIGEAAGDPVLLTVARIKKQYIENLPYSEATIGMAKVFDRLEDVRAAGGGIEWGPNGERPSYVPIARAIVVIEAPSVIAEEPIFCYEHDGKKYAVALWTLRNTSYTRAAKAIYTAANFALRQGLATGCWELTTRREKAGDNFVHVPVLRQSAKNPPDLVEFIHSITGLGQA
jgi:hypothetical protein